MGFSALSLSLFLDRVSGGSRRRRRRLRERQEPRLENWKTIDCLTERITTKTKSRRNLGSGNAFANLEVVRSL